MSSSALHKLDQIIGTVREVYSWPGLWGSGRGVRSTPEAVVHDSDREPNVFHAKIIAGAQLARNFPGSNLPVQLTARVRPELHG